LVLRYQFPIPQEEKAAIRRVGKRQSRERHKAAINARRRERKGWKGKDRRRKEWIEVTEKSCASCGQFLSSIDFGRNAQSRDGMTSKCKTCLTGERINRLNRLKSSPELLAIHRKKALDYFNKKKSVDPIYAMRVRIGNRTRSALNQKGIKKRLVTAEMLGCSFDFYKSYIEGLFKRGMSWKNKSDWQIDHIIPLASARDEKELLALAHYTNTRPLWKKDNARKGAKLVSCQPELLLGMH
jgi:hypothetical protein